MGMSIDESIEVIKHEKPEKPTSMYGMMKKNAFNTAIDTMRKYKKIKEQVDIAINKENFAISGARLIQIREIINGNDD